MNTKPHADQKTACGTPAVPFSTMHIRSIIVKVQWFSWITCEVIIILVVTAPFTTTYLAVRFEVLQDSTTTLRTCVLICITHYNSPPLLH